MLAQSPYDFQLTLRVINSYSKTDGSNVDTLRIGARISGKSVVITVQPKNNRGELAVTSFPPQPLA